MNQVRILLVALLVVVAGTLTGVNAGNVQAAIAPAPKYEKPKVEVEGIDLVAPALQGAPAFPSEDVGFSAYLKLDSITNLQPVAALFNPTDEISETHVIGQMGGLSTINVRLYADVNGWLVAYFPNNQPVSRAARWNGFALVSPTGALDQALEMAVTALGEIYGSVKSDTGYYDWRFPDATDLTVIFRGPGVYSFQFPSSANLFHSSGSGYGVYTVGTYLNGALIIPGGACCSGNSRRDGGAVVVSPATAYTVQNSGNMTSALYLLWDGGSSE